MDAAGDWMSLFRTKNIDVMLAVARDDGLKKVLGPLDLVLMGIGAIVGTGIFVLTGTGALTAGPALKRPISRYMNTKNRKNSPMMLLASVDQI